MFSSSSVEMDVIFWLASLLANKSVVFYPWNNADAFIYKTIHSHLLFFKRNPQFDFLKPTHRLFSFFQQLIEAYAQVYFFHWAHNNDIVFLQSIVAPQRIIKELKDNVSNPQSFLQVVIN